MKYSKKKLVIILAVCACFCMQGCGFITEQSTDSMPISGTFMCKVGPAKEGELNNIDYEPGYGFSELKNAYRIEFEAESAALNRVTSPESSVACTVEYDSMIWGTNEEDTYANLRVTYSGLEYDTQYVLYVQGIFKSYNENNELIAKSDVYTNDFVQKVFLKTISNSSDNSSGGNTSKEELHNSEPAHAHSYFWVTVQDAAAEQDGIEEYRCSCGDVQQTIPINNDMVVYESFANELEKQIKTAEEGATLKLDMNAWHSVPSFLMERIISCGRDVELTYKYQGVLYDITIKAGQGQNLNIPWYGPLLMNSLYGN